jgi:hypothetical protein
MYRNTAKKRKIIFGIIALLIATLIFLTSKVPFNGVSMEIFFVCCLLGVALLFSGFLMQ